VTPVWGRERKSMDTQRTENYTNDNTFTEAEITKEEDGGHKKGRRKFYP